MANPTEASLAVAPSSPPPALPPPLPGHPVIGTSESGAGVQGQSSLNAAFIEHSNLVS
jgi:hypothetical protein